MIYHDVDQNTDAWRQLRLGIPTSSAFDKILTPKKLERSKQADAYMYRLLAEWVAGTPLYEEDYQNRHMERGQAYQDQAVAAYEGLQEVETSPGGFWTIDSGMAGCSPDRMAGAEGILEIKCPSLQRQVEAAFQGVEADHLAQLQGQLMITGREWVDVYSYHPALMLPPKRIHRGQEFIEKLTKAVDEFVEEMLRRRRDLEREHGPFLRLGQEEPEGVSFRMSHIEDIITEEDLDEILRHRHQR